MTRIGLNLLFLVPDETGGREVYARELLAAMQTLDPALEFVAFVNRDGGPRLRRELGDSIRVVELPVSIASRAEWARGELQLLPRAGAEAGIGLLHSPANFGPASGRFRRVLTLHDVHRHPQGHQDPVPLPRRLATDALIRLATRGAARIITGAQAAKDEIVAQLGIAPERIDVVHHGIGKAPVASSMTVADVRAELAIGDRPLALAVGSNLPHKNLPSAIRALAMIAADERPVLALAGFETDSPELRTLARERGVEDDVRLLGFSSDDLLEGLYASADLMVFPTLYEGFGLPPLEAMQRGVPVVSSDIPVVQEVTGNAAVSFDPYDPAAIASAMSRVLRDGALRERMRVAGRARAREFSWEQAGRLTLESYARASGPVRGGG
jgi:glycosyltransferase involved in cell wall biosynthesis